MSLVQSETTLATTATRPSSLLVPLPTKDYVLESLPKLENEYRNSQYRALVSGEKDDYYRRGYNILKKYIDSLISISSQIPDLKELRIPAIELVTFEPLEYILLEGTTDLLLRKRLLELNDEIRSFNQICDDHCESCAKAKKSIAKTYFTISESLSKDTAKFNQNRSEICQQIESLTSIITASIKNEETNRDGAHDLPTVFGCNDVDTIIAHFARDKDLKKDPKRFTSSFITRRITDLSAEARVLAERMNGKVDKISTIFEYQSACSKCTKKFNMQKHLLQEIASYKEAKTLQLPAFDRRNTVSEEKVKEAIEQNDAIAAEHMSNPYVVDYLEDQTHKYLISPIKPELPETESTYTVSQFLTEYQFPENGADFDQIFAAYLEHDPLCSKYQFSVEIKPFVRISKPKTGKRKYFLK